MSLVLDSCVLGLLCHPNVRQHVPAMERLRRRCAQQPSARVYLPEIADYELRRKLLHMRFKESLVRLDNFVRRMHYLPLTTEVMHSAAELWAEARRQGTPAAPDTGLDADIILTAQALAVQATVLTTNIKHFTRFVPVEDWSKL